MKLSQKDFIISNRVQFISTSKKKHEFNTVFPGYSVDKYIAFQNFKLCIARFQFGNLFKKACRGFKALKLVCFMIILHFFISVGCTLKFI